MADNLFANYEQDFRDVFGSLESHLRAIPNLSNGMCLLLYIRLFMFVAIKIY